MTTARGIERKAEAATSAFEESKSKLYRSDGARLYSDDEHQERVKALRKEKDGALEALGEEANAERVKAEAEVEASKNQDLSGKLTTEELTEANARHVFVSEEVQEMTESQLLGRLQSVLQSGDRASIYLHARATRKRAAQEYNRRREAAANAGRSPDSASRSLDLEAEAEKLEDHLFGASRNGEIEGAQKRAEEFMKAQFFVMKHKRPAYTPNYAAPRG